MHPGIRELNDAPQASVADRRMQKDNSASAKKAAVLQQHQQNLECADQATM